jgi:hypothetical protein
MGLSFLKALERSGHRKGLLNPTGYQKSFIMIRLPS